MKRFYLTVSGEKKELFKVNEIKNINNDSYQDLNISFLGQGKMLIDKASNSFFNLMNTDNYQDYISIRESHISVHCNPNKESITIKRTIMINGKEVVTMAQVSPGVKRDKLFVPIIFRFCGEMSSDNLF